jgi:hypothetical protein
MDFWILDDGDSGEWWNWELGFGERENEEVTERESELGIRRWQTGDLKIADMIWVWYFIYSWLWMWMQIKIKLKFSQSLDIMMCLVFEFTMISTSLKFKP